MFDRYINALTGVDHYATAVRGIAEPPPVYSLAVVEATRPKYGNEVETPDAGTAPHIQLAEHAAQTQVRAAQTQEWQGYIQIALAAALLYVAIR